MLGITVLPTQIPFSFFYLKKLQGNAGFQARVLVERVEFTIFTYSQLPLQESDTQYLVGDTIVHEVSFRKKEDISVWGDLGAKT